MGETSPSTPRLVRFGVFEVDLRAGELRKSGVKIKLQEQPFQILALLLERPGEVVTREELQRKLWPADTFVDFEHSLNAAVKRLREALGDSAETPRFVETLPRRGYRFIYPVEGREPPARRRRWVTALALVALPGMLAVMFALNLGGLRDRLLGRPMPGEITSIAVLPLENLSGDPEQDYFTDGMTEMLITELSKIGALKVISRQSVMQFKGTDKPLPEIARELDVDAVVEGSALHIGERVRITVQLIEAATDRNLWADNYDRDVSDVLELHSEVAQAIARQIKIAVTPEEETRLASGRPLNPKAHEAYLRGRYHWNKRTEEGLKKSIEHFQQAVEMDRGYALAYAGLADAYVFLGGYQVFPPKEVNTKAKAAALKALELDDTLAEVHASLAIAKLSEWDWLGAERELKRAIELNPSYATAHHWYAYYLETLGRFDEAVEEIQRARELDPLSLIIDITAGDIMFQRVGQYDKAIAHYRKTLELDPNFGMTHEWLGRAYAQKGMYEEAIAEYQRSVSLSGRSPRVMAGLGYTYAVAGGEAKRRRPSRN